MSVFLGKWIGYYEDVVPNELCNDIIDYTVESKELSPSKYSTHTGESSRSAQRVYMDGKEYSIMKESDIMGVSKSK